jgi:hypothetical protein
MKKSLLFALLIWAGSTVHAQITDTIVAWSFPTGIYTVDIYPDVCTPDNVNRYIAAEDTATEPICDLTFTEGATTFAATATGWNEGENVKLWSIKFKAPGNSNFKVSSKQFSEIDFPGPQDWMVQARLSGGDWVDIDGGTITCGNDWTTGVVSEILLPSEFNDPGTTSIYVRWIMTSNLSTSGGNVEANGISKIDDVVVTGEHPAGMGDIRFDDNFRFYPNPVQSGPIQLEGNSQIQAVNLYSADGKLISTFELKGTSILELPDLTNGIYYVEPVNLTGEKGLSRKLVIQ